MTIAKNTDDSAFDSSLMARSPYYDDFDPQKKFLKVLFKPGQNVQARELSTLQSILQNQVERFGRHVFDNGSLVSGGEVSVSNGFFARIDSAKPLTTTVLNSLVGRKITTTDVTADTIATVVSVLDNPVGTDAASSLTNDSEQLVIFNYSNAGTFTGSVFSTTGDNLTGITFESASSVAPRTGTVSNVVSVEQGIYFIDGYFALNSQQSLAAYSITGGYRNFDAPSASVGFDVTKTIVDVSDDSSLNDPAAGFNNFNSPGADRFKIDPTLAQRSLSGAGDSPAFGISGGTSDYVELVRIDAGTVSKRVKFAQYGDLLRTLARRTFDESGNYTVKPFTLTLDDHQTVFGSEDNTKLGVVLSPGKAYISGYEFETAGPTKFTLDKARTTQKINQIEFNVEESTFIDTDDYQLPRSNTAGQNSLLNGSEFAIFADLDGDDEVDTFIGRANIKNFRPSTTPQQETGSSKPFVRFHFTRFSMIDDPATGTPFSLFRSGKLRLVNLTSRANQGRGGGTPPLTTTNKFIINVDNPGVQIRNLNSGRMVFKLPNTFATSAIDGVNHQFQFNVTKMFSGTATAAGVAEISLPNNTGNVDFIDSISNIIVMATDLSVDGAANDSSFMSIAPVQSVEIDQTNNIIRLQLSAAKFANATFIANIPLQYKNDANDLTIRKASLETVTVTAKPDSDNNRFYVFDGEQGNGYVTNLFDVSQILDSSGTDVTDKFVVDDGQRIDVYDFATLTLAKGEELAVEGDTVTVTLRKFNNFQTAIGSALTRQSYATISELDSYDKSPVFNDPDTGETLRLFDAIDFRPRRRPPSLADFEYGNSEVTNPFNFSSDPSNVSFTTFLPRVDVITLGEDRVLRKIEGTPSLSPIVPVVNEKDMELYRLFIDAFTIDDNSVSARYIDSQRFTMQDIGDLEDTAFSDTEFIYRQSLEAKAISAALGLFPGAENVDSGVYVDDLIGHGNADVTKPQHNVSIDPVTATLHPPFQTFSRGGTLSGGQNRTIYDTNYGRVVTAAGVTTNFIENTAEDSGVGITLSPNPFGIVDYLGTIKLNPSFDRYWSETKAPKVIVNVSGENNAWKKAISAPTGVSGKRFGFGTQWKDWESIWFGRVIGDESTSDSDINDPDNKKYRSNTVRAGFVRRVLSEKITNKVGDRIIDLSVVPYMQAVTITGFVEGVRPNATHYLYFDDNLIGQTSEGYAAGTTGAFNFSVTIPTDVYLTGEKLVQVSNGLTNGDITTATSSADGTFYALGNYRTVGDGVDSVRPAIRRRDASNTDSFLGAEYTDSLGGIGVNVFNSLDPLSQTFKVDANLFNDGLCLESVRLSFASKPNTDGGVVTLQIRPVDDNGSPRRNFVVPFSEKTLTPDEVSTSGLTDFIFESPVYLGPGTYAISVLTNDSEYSLNTTGSPSPNSPLERMFIPRNDGQRTVYSDTSLLCTLVRHSFTVDTTEITFTPTEAYGAINPSVVYFANARNILSQSPITTVFDLDGASNVTAIPNKSVNFLEQTSGKTNNVTLRFTPTERVSPIIDEAQCKLLNIESFTSATANVDSETQASDERSDSVATYYSKIVTLTKSADNLNVRISGVLTAQAQVDVYAKVSGDSDADLESTPYIQLQPQGGATSVSENNTSTVVQNFASATSESTGESVLGTFTQYMFKIVITNNGNVAKDLPLITSVAAVPLGKKVTSEFFETITPTGAIVPYVSLTPPPGWLNCDGTILTETDETKALRDRLGSTFNFSEDGAGIVRLPHLRSRVPVGARPGDQSENIHVGGQGHGDQRILGSTGGANTLKGHNHINPIEASDRHAGQRWVWSDEQAGYGPIRGEHFGAGDSFAGKSYLGDGEYSNAPGDPNGDGRGLLLHDGIDVCGASLDKSMTEQMPPFLVLNYIIKL